MAESQRSCFWLDQQAVPFTPGQSVLQAATAAGHVIPHLCHHDGLTPHGSCRTCIVRIGGKIMAACTTPAQTDMKVELASASLQQQRRQIVELLFAEGNHLCPGCEASGHCQLQALAYDLGMTHYEFDPLYPRRPSDSSHPAIFVDQDRCIYCDLCNRAARQLDHKIVFGLGGRGADTYLFAHSDSGALGDTALDGQDQAAHICPVGCLLPRQGNYRIPIGQRRNDKAEPTS